MKKINAFYCIKTPSDWKESVLMYDKPTEKNKTKLTGFQLAGAVLAALLLVVGGAMTLFRDEGDIEITPSASSAAQEESSAQDSSQTAEIDYGKAAEEGLLKLISDDEIVIEGIFAGATSNGDCYIFVDKIYSSAKPYVEVNDDIKDVYDVASLMSANRVLRFKVDFGVKDKTTGKAVYAQDIDIGSAVVIGTKFEDDISFVTAYDIVTHYDTTEDWQGDGMGTQLYSELCSAVAAVHDIDTSTDEGENLIDPGRHPETNLQFQFFLAAVLAAVDNNAELLRLSASSAGNDHRLGANEAPPAIISVFLGEQLEDVLEQLISTGEATHSLKGGKLQTGVDTLPDLAKDATDRNRTSPFAFTGNKFEFRMVGSRDSIAGPNVVLNTIVAEAFSEACDVLEKADNFDEAVHDLIKKYATEHQRVVFDGNGYSDAWVEEAARRGLPNIKNTVDATSVLADPEVIKLFEKHGVFSAIELAAREEVGYENYSKAINIEARTMIDMVKKEIIPAVMEYTCLLYTSPSPRDA